MHRVKIYFVIALLVTLAAGRCHAAPAVVFSGSGSYANMGANYFNGLTNLTQEAWIRVSESPNETGFGKTGVIAGLGLLGGSDYGFGLYISGDGERVGWQLRYAKATTSVSAPYAFDGLWHHVAVTRQGPDVRLYLDGQLKSTATMPETPITSDATFALGARSAKSGNNWNYNFFLKGDIADVRLWNYARSAAEISDNRYNRLTGSEPGLIGYWRMDEGSGSKINSAATPNRQGTLTGTSWTSDPALVFNSGSMQILPPFLLANPVTGSTRFTNTNEVRIASFEIPDGYTHCKITADGGASAISAGGWLPVATPPTTTVFDRPPATANVIRYLWFTNTSASVKLNRSLGTIIYTEDAKPTASARSDVTFVLDRGAPVVVNGHNLHNSRNGGKALGVDMAITFLTPLFVSGDSTNATPDANMVTLCEPGDYTMKVVAMNEAGNTATSGVANVHVRQGAEHAASFSGASSLINFGADKFGRMGSFTVSAWIKTATRPDANIYGYGRSGGIAGQGYLGNFQNGYGIYANGGSLDGTFDRLIFQFRLGGVTTSLIHPFEFDGQWHHIAGVRDSTNILLYVDGVLVGSAALASSSSFAPEQKFYVGDVDSSVAPFRFKGVIADVQLWGRALSGAFIRETMCMRLQGGDADLLGYWPLNEGVGATAWDHSGRGNNGTMTSVTWATPDGLLDTITTLPDYFHAAPFVVADVVSGSPDYTARTNVDVAAFPAPAGYTHYQISTNGLAAAIDDEVWTPLATPPLSLSFALPATNASVSFYAWFTNDIQYAYLARGAAYIDYLAPLADPVIPDAYTRQLVPGRPVVIYPEELADTDLGLLLDSDSPLQGSVLFIGGTATNHTPDSAQVTVDQVGFYSVRLVIADIFGRAATSGVCQVTVAAWAGAPFAWTGARGSDWADGRNWDLRSTPCAGAAVTIGGNADVALRAATPRLKSLTVSGGKLTVSGWATVIDAATVTFTNCTVSHLANTAVADPWVPDQRLHIRGDVIDIAAGAVVSANSVGYGGGRSTDGIGPAAAKWVRPVVAAVTADTAGAMAAVARAAPLTAIWRSRNYQAAAAAATREPPPPPVAAAG